MAPVVRAAPRAVLVAAGVVLGRLVVQQPSFVLCLARRTGWPGSQRRPKAVDLCSREPAIAPAQSLVICKTLAIYTYQQLGKFDRGLPAFFARMRGMCGSMKPIYRGGWAAFRPRERFRFGARRSAPSVYI